MNKEESAKLLDKAAQICVNKHLGQRDKTGSAYFQHPMRVAMRCNTDKEKMVALLHDVIEDTDVTPDYLLQCGFPQDVVDAILSVTKREGENYEVFIRRANLNPIGRVVKLNDLEDNLNVLRLETVSPEMANRFSKYLAARRYLLDSRPTEDGINDVQPIEYEPEPEPEVIPQEIPEEKNDTSYALTRVVLSRSESHRQQRARINRRLRNYRPTGGTEFMKNKISVLMPDKKIISEYATYQSFMQVVEYIGFDCVASLGMKYGNYPIVTKEPKGGNRYAKANNEWYILSNWPTTVVAQYINDIADALDLYIECDVVPK